MDKITIRLKTRLKVVKTEVKKLLRERALIEEKLLKRLPENEKLEIIHSEHWKTLQ
jgi:hypothetical protein